MKIRKPAAPLKRKTSARRSKLARPSSRNVYPFSAIVGQEEMKLALLLNVIDPLIGGVLVMGHRGTGKSTAVRGLAELLPQIRVVRGCPYRCDPAESDNLCEDCQSKRASGGKLESELEAVRVIDLPLGATEDRVCGSIDLERALLSGRKTFEPGLLASANRGFLYIDEVNLLDDHLVNLLLDVAATGRNQVQREGISVEHPSRFVLIGSGNPEEGELRPQLQDRFGFHVEVTTDNDLDARVSIVRKREEFERNPKGFCISLEPQQKRLQSQISDASRRAAKVKLDDTLLQQIAELCSELKIDGHRGELTIARAARALTAFEGRTRVDAETIKRVAVMSLRHRLRRDALEETASAERIKQALERVFSPRTAAPGRSPNDHGGQPSTEPERRSQTATSDQGTRAARARNEERVNPLGQIGAEGQVRSTAPTESRSSSLPELKINRSRSDRSRFQMSGRGESSRFMFPNPDRGRYRRAVAYKTARVALDATLRTAALQNYTRYAAERFDKVRLTVNSDSLRYKLFARKKGKLFIVAIDTSGSMAFNRINLAKATLLELLKKSYVHRDRVAIVAFGGTEASVLLPPSSSMLRARRVLESLNVGGGTPLAAGLMRSLEIARSAIDQSAETMLLLFTDGGANVPWRQTKDSNRAERRELIEKEIARIGLKLQDSGVTTVLVETPSAFISRDDAQRLAQILPARLVRLKSAVHAFSSK